MATMGYILMIAGSAKQAQAQRDLGRQKKVLADYKADQLNVMAGQEQAKSQHVALERMRKSRIANSRALALAAASGAGAGDVGVNNIMAGIDAEGVFASEMAIYDGEEKARNFEMDAVGERYSGEVEQRAGAASAKATMIGAAGKFASGFSSASLTEKYSPTGMGEAYA